MPDIPDDELVDDLTIDEPDEPTGADRPNRCRVCDIALIGLPRTRQYCDEHRPPADTRPSRRLSKKAAAARRRPSAVHGTSTAGAPSTASGAKIALDEAGRILEDTQARAIAQIGMFAPIVAGVWAERMEANTRALLTIAAGRPKLLASIIKMAEAEAYWDLATFGGAIIVAAGVEAGFVQGDGTLAMGLEITEIWEEVEAQREAAARRVAGHYDIADRPPAPPPAAHAEGLAAEL